MTDSVGQKVVGFWVPREGDGVGERQDREFYARMFAEDVHNSIVPYSRSGREDFFALEITPGDDGGVTSVTEDAIVAAFDGSERGSRYGLARALSAWVRANVFDLLTFGRAWFEVVIERKPSATAAPSFRVVRAVGGSVRRSLWQLGSPQQTVPKGAVIAEGIHAPTPESRSRQVDLSGALMVEARLAGEVARLSHAYHALKGFGTHLPSDELLGLGDVPPTRRIPFDFTVFRKTEDRAIASLCRRTGWRARTMQSGLRTDAYEVELMLRFAFLCAELRALLVRAANDILNLTGRELGFEARLRNIGLLTSADVLDLQRRAGMGTVSYNDLITAVYEHVLPTAE